MGVLAILERLAVSLVLDSEQPFAVHAPTGWAFCPRKRSCSALRWIASSVPSAASHSIAPITGTGSSGTEPGHTDALVVRPLPAMAERMHQPGRRDRSKRSLDQWIIDSESILGVH